MNEQIKEVALKVARDMKMPTDETLESLRADFLGRCLAELSKDVEPVSYEFQALDGRWHPFIDQRHFDNTKADGRWPIRALFTHPSPQTIEAAVLAEREECAKACEELASRSPDGDTDKDAIEYCADAIRARTK
jgi:hypothetical protein